MSTSPSVPDSQNVAPLDDVLSSPTPSPLSAEAVDPVTRLLHAAEGLALLRVRMLPVTRSGAAGPVVSDTEICDECQRQRVLSGMAHAGSCMVGQVLEAVAAVRAEGAGGASPVAPPESAETWREFCHKLEHVSLGDAERIAATIRSKVVMDEATPEDWIWETLAVLESEAKLASPVAGVSVQTGAYCPSGCGGFLNSGDRYCPGCRYCPNEQRVKSDPNWCWQWFGSMSHRMKCRRHLAHTGEHYDHSDSEATNISTWGSAKLKYERRPDGYLYAVAAATAPAAAIETEQEVDGRWIAEVPSVPGAMAYGTTEAEAKRKAQDIAAPAAEELIQELRLAGERRVVCGRAIAVFGFPGKDVLTCDLAPGHGDGWHHDQTANRMWVAEATELHFHPSGMVETRLLGREPEFDYSAAANAEVAR